MEVVPDDAVGIYIRTQQRSVEVSGMIFGPLIFIVTLLVGPWCLLFPSLTLLIIGAWVFGILLWLTLECLIWVLYVVERIALLYNNQLLRWYYEEPTWKEIAKAKRAAEQELFIKAIVGNELYLKAKQATNRTLPPPIPKSSFTVR